MDPTTDNRAVSALFRVFGGQGKPVVAEGSRRAEAGALHRAEWIFFAVLVPLTVLVAVAEGLVRACGPWIGGALALPAAFLAWTSVPFLLGGGNAVTHWRRWLVVMVAWAWFRRGAGGVPGAFAWLWLGIAGLNVVSTAILGWRRSMTWKGRAGMAWRVCLAVVSHAVMLVIGLREGLGWALVFGTAIAGCWCWGVLRPASRFFGPVRSRLDDGGVLLTIDDGPDPADTPELLDLLDRAGRKAVFFVIGDKVRQFPGLAREIVRRGHELGNHTMTHPQASFWCAGPARTRREIEDCNRAIEEVTGVRPRWFRAPVGHRNFFTHPVTGELGLEILAWKRRGFDAVSTDVGRILRRLLDGCGPGDIFLLHESTPVAAEVLRGVLAGLDERKLGS